MKKTILRLVCIFIVAVVCFGNLYGCSNDPYDRLKTVEIEVDYSPIFVTGRGISINNEEDFYVDKVSKVFDYDPNGRNSGGPSNFYLWGDNVFFTVQYGGYHPYTDPLFKFSGKTIEEVRHKRHRKIAFFKTNVKTGECQLILDFGEVTDIGKNIIQKYQPDVFALVDEQKAALMYNGKLVLYDMDSQAVVQNFDVFDPTDYLCWESSLNSSDVDHFPFRMYGKDYCANFGDRLEYYKYNGDVFEKYNFENVEVGAYTGIADNCFYSYKFKHDGAGNTKSVPTLCFNTETLEEFIPTDEELKRLKNYQAAQTEDSEDDFAVENGGSRYNVTKDSDGIFDILDSEGRLVKRVDKELLDSNVKFKELVAIDPNNDFAEPEYYFVSGERLYFICIGDYNMFGSTPRLIFEYDFESESLKYAGLISRASRLWKVIIQ